VEDLLLCFALLPVMVVGRSRATVFELLKGHPRFVRPSLGIGGIPNCSTEVEWLRGHSQSVASYFQTSA
jgi:hypothetical protein